MSGFPAKGKPVIIVQMFDDNSGVKKDNAPDSHSCWSVGFGGHPITS